MRYEYATYRSTEAAFNAIRGLMKDGLISRRDEPKIVTRFDRRGNVECCAVMLKIF